MPPRIVMAYYSNLVIRRQASEFTFLFEISEFRVSTLIYFLLSELLGEPVVFSSDSTGVEDIAAQGVLLPLR